VVNGMHRPLTPEKQNRYPLYSRLSGPWRRSGRGRQISPGPRLEHQTLQPVASHYTDCTIQVTNTDYTYAHLVIFKVNCRSDLRCSSTCRLTLCSCIPCRCVRFYRGNTLPLFSGLVLTCETPQCHKQEIERAAFSLHI